MQIIPLSATPAQTLDIILGDQSCKVNVYEKSTGLFLDLIVSESPVVVGVICRDLVRLVRYAYLGFSGDLAFFDTQGANDPTSDGLGARYQLAYFP